MSERSGFPPINIHEPVRDGGRRWEAGGKEARRKCEAGGKKVGKRREVGVIFLIPFFERIPNPKAIKFISLNKAAYMGYIRRSWLTRVKEKTENNIFQHIFSFFGGKC